MKKQLYQPFFSVLLSNLLILQQEEKITNVTDYKDMYTVTISTSLVGTDKIELLFPFVEIQNFYWSLILWNG